jgi:excisionase family DNA binding protein
LYDALVILEDYATVLEASEVLRVHPETVKRLCRRGQITANKLGNTWLINRETLAFFAVTYDSNAGRPKRSELPFNKGG